MCQDEKNGALMAIQDWLHSPRNLQEYPIQVKLYLTFPQGYFSDLLV